MRQQENEALQQGAAELLCAVTPGDDERPMGGVEIRCALVAREDTASDEYRKHRRIFGCTLLSRYTTFLREIVRLRRVGQELHRMGASRICASGTIHLVFRLHAHSQFNRL